MIEIEQTTKQNTQVHEDKFLKVLWDETTWIIGVDWKEATSAMTDEEFKSELTLFAGQVEQKKAHCDFRAVVERGAVVLEPPTDKKWGVRTAYFKGPGDLKFEIEGPITDR